MRAEVKSPIVLKTPATGALSQMHGCRQVGAQAPTNICISVCRIKHEVHVVVLQFLRNHCYQVKYSLWLNTYPVYIGVGTIS